MEIWIGKEYELGNSAEDIWLTIGSKVMDGSGPPEIAIGPFKSPNSALIGELMIISLWGKSVWEYYQKDDNEIEKGNHIHITEEGKPNKFIWGTAVALATIYRKLLTLNGEFRPSVTKWAKYYIPTWEYAEKIVGEREYWAVTPNRKNGKNTVEIRLSEGLLAQEIPGIALSMATYRAFKKEFGIDLAETHTIVDSEDVETHTGTYPIVPGECAYVVATLAELVMDEENIYGRGKTIRETLKFVWERVIEEVQRLPKVWRPYGELGVMWVEDIVIGRTKLRRMAYELAIKVASRREIAEAKRIVTQRLGWQKRQLERLIGITGW